MQQVTMSTMVTRARKSCRETQEEFSVAVNLRRIPGTLLQRLNDEGCVRIAEVEKREHADRKRRSQDLQEPPVCERTRSRLHTSLTISSDASAPASPASSSASSTSSSSTVLATDLNLATPRRSQRRRNTSGASRDSLVQRVQRLTLQEATEAVHGPQLRSRSRRASEEPTDVLLISDSSSATGPTLRPRGATTRKEITEVASSESDAEVVSKPSPAVTPIRMRARPARRSRRSQREEDAMEAEAEDGVQTARSPLLPIPSSICRTPLRYGRVSPASYAAQLQNDLSALYDDSPLSQASIKKGKRKQRFRLLRSRRIDLGDLSLSFDSTIGATSPLGPSPPNALFDDAPGTDYRAELLQRFGQKEPLMWEDVLPPDAKENYVQIGEGDFAQVYRSLRGKGDVVLKVMAACDDADRDAAWWIKGFSHYVPEVIASQMVTDLRFKYHENRCTGFAPLNRCCIVKGKFPADLADLTHNFREERGVDQEDLLEEICGDHQEWIVLEFPYCGASLDSLTLLDITDRGMRSIVAQVSLSLAAAELAFQMEHRDLHFGNILVRKLHDSQAKLRYRVEGRNYSVVTEGYVATIIDYTLSRVTGENGRVTYVDLMEDQEEDEDNLPKHLEVHFQTKEMNKDNWQAFNPKSNILWVQFLARQFCDELRDAPMAKRRQHRNDTNHAAIISELECLSDDMEKNFDSCAALVASSFFFDAFRYDETLGV